MAGMLPGVESARRRRLHQGGSRRSSSNVYTTSHETFLTINPMQWNTLNKRFHGGALGNLAKEAKQRLDERLRTQTALATNIMGGMGATKSRCNGEGSSSKVLANVQGEVFCSKKSLSRKFSWGKIGWKASDQDECVVCLEEFKTGDILVNLPCAHRFHWSCMVPWLETNSYCPCCRMTISS